MRHELCGAAWGFVPALRARLYRPWHGCIGSDELQERHASVLRELCTVSAQGGGGSSGGGNDELKERYASVLLELKADFAVMWHLGLEYYEYFGCGEARWGGLASVRRLPRWRVMP